MKLRHLFSIILFLSTISITSCNRDSLKGCEEHQKGTCNEDANKTNIRIVNGSKFDFCNIVLNPSDGNVNYGTIEKGNVSCYKTFEKAFNSAYVTLKIGDRIFTLQPIDFIGEPTLGTGNFTYSLDVLNFNDGTLSIKTTKN